MRSYLVGGAVRDKLLGYPHHERDWVVVGGTPEQMLAAGFKPVGRDFPVFLHPQTSEEYALARTERKSGHGYHGFTVHSSPDITLEQDLERRDLTINAIAEDVDGQLIDPYGGRRDLEQRVLRHVSPAFAEDPLRILRVARFAARYHHLGFRVAEETIALMRDIVAAGEVEHLVAERIWKETERALGEPNPEVYFQLLDRCGALARLAPPLSDNAEALAALAQSARHSAEPLIRFTVLCAQLEADTALVFCERIKAPNDYRELTLLAIAQFNAIAGCDTAQNAAAILDSTDAWRRPQRFELLLQAATARQFDPERIERLRNAYRAAATITAQPLLQRGFSGKALGAELQRERLRAIEENWQ